MLQTLALVMAPMLVGAEPTEKKVPLFATQKWYQNQKGKEQPFTGKLIRLKGGGGIGFGRFNPYRLVMKKDTREVYIGGRPQLLAPYIGKEVTIIGKPVDMEVEGSRHREIWPAALVLAAANGTKEGGDPSKEGSLKVQARMYWSFGSRTGAGPQQYVIRSEKELTKAMPLRVRDLTNFLAQRFKVKEIDWKKQMVIIATGGSKPTGGYSVKITDLMVKGNSLTVKWKLNSPKPGSFVTQAFTHPGEAVLVPNFKGKVVFDPPAKKTIPKD